MTLNAIKAGAAYVAAYLDKTELKKGLDSVTRDLRRFSDGIAAVGTKFMAAGAAITGPLVGALKVFDSLGSQLNDMAARTGMSTNALSELAFAAELSGQTIEVLELSIKRMQKSIEGGGAEFKKLKLSLQDLKAMSPDKQFEKIMDAIGGLQSPAERTAAAIAIFGKSGTALVPLAGQIGKLRQEAVALGLSIGPEQARLADELGDAWLRAKKLITMALFQIGAALAENVVKATNHVIKMIVGLNDWITANGEVIRSTGILGLKLLAFGGILYAMAKAIGIAIIAAKGLNIAFAMLAANPILAGLVVLTTVAVALLAEAFFDAKMGALGLGQALDDIKATGVGKNLGVIRKALAAGDIAAVEGQLKELERKRKAAEARHKQFEQDMLESGRSIPYAGQQESLREANDLFTVIEKVKKKLEEMRAAKGKSMDWEGVFGGIAHGIWGAGKAAGDAIEGFAARMKESKSILDEFQHLVAQGIADPRNREEALVNLEYDAKKLEATGRPDDQAVIERSRAQALLNIAERYAREAADKRKDIEGDVNDEIARMKIDTTRKGIGKELALLELKHQRERDAAEAAGADVKKIDEKFALARELLLQGQEKETGGPTRGTFSAAAVSGLGVGGGALSRIAAATQDSAKQQAAQLKVMEKQLQEIKALNLELQA